MASIDDYLAHLQVERRMSPHTFDAYRRDLDGLNAFATAQGLEVETLHTEQVRAFIAAEKCSTLKAWRFHS